VELVLIASFLVAGLFGGMLVFSEVGRRIGVARLARDASGLAQGAGAAEGAVFGLLGLLIAFSFSGAASRFEDRRHLIVEEANAIGTAYLRLDLLPGDARAELQDLFRKYLDSRLATYRGQESPAATEAKRAEGTALQEQIWTKSLTALRREGVPPHASMLLMPALNEMIDITATRVMATLNHPPPVVFMLLGGLSFVGALLVGYSTSINKGRSWFHTLAFAAILSLTVYVIADLEFPRLGLIRVDAADQVLIEVRQSMK
jgi:hypothetical protein